MLLSTHTATTELTSLTATSNIVFITIVLRFLGEKQW